MELEHNFSKLIHLETLKTEEILTTVIWITTKLYSAIS